MDFQGEMREVELSRACDDPEHQVRDGVIFCTTCYAKRFVDDLWTFADLSKPFVDKLKQLGQ